ncbi:MAG: zinc-binding dehydrogenase [Actinomycetes bacterium]
MKALRIERRLVRFAAARIASSIGSGRGAGIGPLRLVDVSNPNPPTPGWHAVTPILAGICGSDLATVDGRSSRYFEGVVSFPFIPGHEIVGRLVVDGIDANGTNLSAGSRVVIQPVLGCAARGLSLCAACSTGDVGRCGHLSHGHLQPGLQTGYCSDTGGGWSEGPLWAHASQIFAVPDALSDDDAVTVEPMACALHAAIRARYQPDDVVGIIGAGTLGLGVLTSIAFLDETTRVTRPRQVIVGARYPVQRQLATTLGADEVVSPSHLSRSIRAATRSLVAGRPDGRNGQLLGGANVVIDCVGSEASLTEALSMVAPGGRIILVGMPGRVTIDLASLWHREVELIGAYAYGTEHCARGSERTFDLAIEMAGAKKTGQFVSARYSLDHFEEALAHAGAAGPRGAVKIVFEATPSRTTTKREG